MGNNVANVNTYGFKKSRVTFSDTMNQTISGASAATENRGGTNAKQVGLGSTIATIDTIHSQSSLQTTGRDLDLAISGDGYFVVKQGDALSYTRAGNFYLDDNGTLVNSNGLKVQAYQVDAKGSVSNKLDDVSINVNAVLPAVSTTTVGFTENLASNAIVGSVFSQQIQIVDQAGKPQSATIYFKKLSEDKWGVYANNEPKPSEVSTTGDIKITKTDAYTGLENAKWNLNYKPDANGDYELTIGDKKIQMKLNESTKKLQAVKSADRTLLKGLEIDLSSVVKQASATINVEDNTSTFKIKIEDASGYTGSENLPLKVTWDVTAGKYKLVGADDATIATFDNDGIKEVTVNGGKIKVSVSGYKALTKPIDPATTVTAPATVTDEQLEEYKNKLESYEDYVSYYANIEVIPKSPLNPKAPATTTGIGSINITAATQPDTTLNFVDGKIPYSKSSVDMSLKVPTGLADDEDTKIDESLQVLKGIKFDFSKLTQVDGTTTALVNPDGNTEGKLESFNFGASGEINGVYSNGEIVTLGQMAIAKFSNASGLTKTGGSTFQESINSGTANIGVAGDGRGTLASGSLEMSNVDLSEEFTEMIVAQRGFQSNSRIITTSDEILQELVNLKR
ncbi:flagellar hook protein FlgE [Peribacillus sp. NPDC097206]|uniref:flagellar hook protein FlgE n=1 Tax=unclassified Peribacillus TaxID=2675266 RepID=UPI0037F470DD